MNENTIFSKTMVEDFGLLDVEYIDPHRIFDMCLRLNVNVCVVDQIMERKNTVTVKCDVIDVEPRPETFRDVLEELYTLD